MYYHGSQSTELLQLRDHAVDILDLASSLSWWRLCRPVSHSIRAVRVSQKKQKQRRKRGQTHTRNLQGLEPSLVLNSKVGQRLLLQRLLLRLHDVGQAGVPRLVQPQIGRDDHGQLGPQRLNTAVDLARHFDGAVLVLDLDLAGLRRLRPAQEAGKHLSRLALVAVDGLLPQQDEVDVLRLDDALQQLRDRQGLQAAVVRLRLGKLDVERPVRTHGHGGAERVGALGPASGQGEDVVDLQRALAFAEADGLLDGELIEGVEGVLDTRGLDARLGLVDSGFDLVSAAGTIRQLAIHRTDKTMASKQKQRTISWSKEP